ncbi:MAG: thioredoxin [bacterium]
MSEVTFTDKNFKEEVLQSEGLVLVDFFAPWCGPCNMLAPIIKELAKDNEGKVKIGKLNIDENPEISQKYQVMSIPTLIFFHKGENKEQLMGLNRKEDLQKKIDELLN